MTPDVVFEERQRPPPAWYAFGTVAVALGVAWALWISVRLDELQWELLVLYGIAAVVVAVVRMRTVVTRTHLRITIAPFPRKTVDLADVERCEPTTYRPLVHYGGWGWRWSPSRGWAYTMRGNRGVMVHRRGGKAFLVGSQRPEQLAAAIESRRP